MTFEKGQVVNLCERKQFQLLYKKEMKSYNEMQKNSWP